jgi:hypothetical protein
VLENDLRVRAGEAGYSGGFIEHYVVRVIYPPGLTRGMQIGLGLFVLQVALLGYWGFLRRHDWRKAWQKPSPPAVRSPNRANHGHQRVHRASFR